MRKKGYICYRPDLICTYIHQRYTEFERRKFDVIEHLTLPQVMNTNAYLLSARHSHYAHSIVDYWAKSYLLSLESDFLTELFKGIATLIAKTLYDGQLSTVPGIDLEFLRQDTYYLVAMALGPDQMHNAQREIQERRFEEAFVDVKKAHPEAKIQCVWGIFYGSNENSCEAGYLCVAGQNFWHWLSGDPDLYLTLFDGLYNLKEDDAILDALAAMTNRLVMQFCTRFCTPNYDIDWPRLIEYNSGNLDLDEFLARPEAG